MHLSWQKEAKVHENQKFFKKKFDRWRSPRAQVQFYKKMVPNRQLPNKGPPKQKEGNDTLFTYFGLRKWFYLWLNHNYSMKRRIDDEIMISAKDSTAFPSPLSLPPSLWGNDVAKYFNDLELVIKRSLFGFWSLVDIRGYS